MLRGPHRDQNGSGLGRETVASLDLRLRKRAAEVRVDAHHLTGALHFGTEQRIDTRELHEGEDRLLDREVLRDDRLREVERLQCLPRHDPGRQLRQRATDRLRHERHGPGCAGIHLDHVDLLVLHRVLHVHQTPNPDLEGEQARRLRDLVEPLRRQRIGRQRAGRVTRMNPRLLDVLHDAAHHDALSITDRVHVDLDRVGEEAVDQDRMLRGRAHGEAHVAPKLFHVLNDLHGATAEHVGRPDEDRVSDLFRDLFGLLLTSGDVALRPHELQLLQHLVEALPILGAIDRVRGRPDDRRAGLLERDGELQRGLTTELHDHAFRLLEFDDLEHVFEGERFEVEAIARVVVRRNRLGVAVDHDGLVTGLTEREDCVHAAVVELDPLTDAIGPASEDDDLAPIARLRLALVLVGRIEIGRMRDELRGAGIDALVDGADPQTMALIPNRLLGRLPERSDAGIGEAELFGGPKQSIALRLGRPRQVRLRDRDLLEVAQEPGVDARPVVDLLDGDAAAKRLDDCPGTFRARCRDLLPELFLSRLTLLELRRLEARVTDLERSDRLLKALLEGPANRHRLPDRFHLRRQLRIGEREFLEGEARNLRHDVVDRRLEGRRGLPGDVVLDLVERVSDGQLCGHLGDRETRRLRSERRGAGDARIHLDHDQRTVLGVHTELHVRTAGIDPDLPHDRDRSVAHLLILAIRQGLGRRDGDRVTRVYAHRVEIFDRADDHDIVGAIAHHLELVFLPPEHRLLDQNLVRGRLIQRPLDHAVEVLVPLTDASSGAAHREARPNDRRQACLFEDFAGFREARRDARRRHRQTETLHRSPEQLTIFGFVNRLEARPDQLDPVALQHTRFREVDREIQRRLPTERRQQGVGSLGGDDLLDGGDGHGLDVGAIRRLRVRHDRRRVRIQEYDPVALFTKRFAGLGTGVIELAGLTDHDRT